MKRFISSMFLRRFARCEQGSVFPIVGFGIIMLVGATGVAIDMGRVQTVQSRMSHALDAAGLAAGSVVSTTDPNVTVNKYFYANFTANYMGTTITSLTVTPNADSTILNLSVKGTVPTTFMKIFGVNSVKVGATSQITRAAKGMELVLVMDNTGSMGNPVNPSNSNTTKISAAKSAVAILLDSLYGASHDTVQNLWVGVVPFSQSINVGSGFSSWVAPNSYDWGVPVHPWGGCVMARLSPYDVTDAKPTTNPFPAFYAVTTGTITNPISGTGVSGTCTSPTNPAMDNPWKCTVFSSNKNKLTYDFSNNKSPNANCAGTAILPMVAEKSKVLTRINAMTASGSTFINLGMAWASHMLSPDWQGLWGGQMNTNNLPLKYNTPLMYKVVVLMTDGMNSFSQTTFSSYGFLSDNQLGTTKTMNTPMKAAYAVSAEKVLDDRTKQICDNLKANGVIIYTVGFGTDDLNNFNSNTSVNGPLLRACASKNEYYFLAPTNAQLQSAFKQIGDSLANLRISQ